MTNTPRNAIEIESVEKRFSDHIALSSVSFDVSEGTCAVLLGPSGAGKTTMLRMIAGLETPDAGSVRLFGEDVANRAPVERPIAMVSQDTALYPQLSVQQNLATSLKKCRLSRQDTTARIAETLEAFRLSDRADYLPSQLSGGEAQRAAFARAVASRPKILLLDEPLSQLDGRLKTELIELTQSVTSRYHLTTVLVTHDSIDAARLADSLVVLEAGKLVGSGTFEQLYRHPGSRTCGDLLSHFGMNWLDANQDAKLRTAMEEQTGAPDQDHSSPADCRFCGFRAEDALPVSEEIEAFRVTEHDIELPFRVDTMKCLGFTYLLQGTTAHERLVRVACAEPPASIGGLRVAKSKLRWVES